MSHRSRIIWVLALLVAVPLAAACGAAEEPAANAANAPADEAPAPEPEPEPEPATPETTEPEDTASQEPELVGEIRVSNEDFEWGETTTESAAYTWTARVTNDTTATLAITVRF